MHSASSRVLITGATGFIGCRLAERLALGRQVQVRALVHSWSGPGLAKLGRLPIEMVRGDLLQPQTLREAISDCDTVVHCAFGNRGRPEQQADVTIDGTRNLLQASTEARVSQFIHLSTAVVHGRAPHAKVINESSAFQSDGDTYSHTKIEAEKLVWKHQRSHSLPVTVFRPPIVYGPNGTWTRRLLRDLSAGVCLINDGQGIANVIYIDNLINALLLAIDKQEAINQAFIATDDDVVSWRQFYASHADVLANVPPLRSIDLGAWQKTQRKRRARQWANAVGFPLRIAATSATRGLKDVARQLKAELDRTAAGRALIDLIPRSIKRKVKAHVVQTSDSGGEHSIGQVYPLPDANLTLLHTCRARFSNDKMKKLLGWQQQTSYAEAMDLIRDWASYQRLAA